jgi:hypothetical protein
VCYLQLQAEVADEVWLITGSPTELAKAAACHEQEQ